MDVVETTTPSKALIDSYLITTGKTEAFLDGKIDKESIYVKGINYSYNDVVITKDPFLAQIKIKTKARKTADYKRVLNKRLNTINVTDKGIEKDSFAGIKLNVIAQKLTLETPSKVEIELKPKVKVARYLSDKSSLVFSSKLCANLTIGVGLCINTDGVVTNKKKKLKIENCTKVEVFIKVTTGYNPLSKLVELDENKVVENTRGQVYLLESELYDVVKMKHLMDIDKETILD